MSFASFAFALWFAGVRSFGLLVFHYSEKKTLATKCDNIKIWTPEPMHPINVGARVYVSIRRNSVSQFILLQNKIANLKKKEGNQENCSTSFFASLVTLSANFFRKSGEIDVHHMLCSNLIYLLD